MNRTCTARIRRLVLTAAAGAVLATAVTACGSADGSGPASGGDSAATTKATADASSGTPQESSDSGKTAGSSSNGGTSGKGRTSSAGAESAPGGGKKGYGQACGANDLKFSARSETQAGGYLLLSARAKPGITCTIPGGLPSVSFGSKGIEATSAEQAVGPAIKLGGSTTVYAGINPKTTKGNAGVEFTFLIASIGTSDPNPASVSTGSVTVDKPIVTNWHTAPADAVPGDGTDS